tara:strand:+ start:9804 stop:10055 length:252 start_codon:yes stop_codon:yes gene_type:complete
MKTFFDNNYGVSIINNEFTNGVELAVLLGNESMYMIIDEQVYSGLDTTDVDSIISEVSSRKALSDIEVEKSIERYKKELQEIE